VADPLPSFLQCISIGLQICWCNSYIALWRAILYEGCGFVFGFLWFFMRFGCFFLVVVLCGFLVFEWFFSVGGFLRGVGEGMFVCLFVFWTFVYF
jgi:hypothetical protein